MLFSAINLFFSSFCVVDKKIYVLYDCFIIYSKKGRGIAVIHTVIKKEMAKRIVSVVLVICMLGALSACNVVQSAKVDSLLMDFQQACNCNDVSTALDYIIPTVSDKIRVATGIVGMLSQKSEEEMFLMLANWLSGEELSDVNFLTTLNIEVQQIVLSEDKESATADTIVTYELFGEQSVREAVFDCEYYAEQWYISGFTFM